MGRLFLFGLIAPVSDDCITDRQRLRIESLSMSKKAIIPCPICAKETDFFQDPLGPFCSNRCKMVDLGKWLNEEYRVSEPLKPHHFEEFEKLECENPDTPEYH